MHTLRVFLSHTSDLGEPLEPSTNFVETAIRTIAALAGLSVEEQTATFTAEDLPPEAVIRRRLADCALYVGIVGYARGTPVRDDAMARSFVELEFDIAGELHINRLVFVWDAGATVTTTTAPEQCAFRARLAKTQEIVFEQFKDRGDLRLSLERSLRQFLPPTSEHVSCHVEWATLAELRSVGLGAPAHRWAVYVRNGGEYPAWDIEVAVRSNNGGEDLLIDMGTLAPRDVTSAPYVLNLEAESFDPEGDRPIVDFRFTMAGVRWHKRPNGSLLPEAPGRHRPKRLGN